MNKTIRKGRARRSNLSEDAATKRFKALMKKHAGKHRFEGLDEGEPPSAIPNETKKGSAK